jgi:hypothetical protein
LVKFCYEKMFLVKDTAAALDETERQVAEMESRLLADTSLPEADAGDLQAQVSSARTRLIMAQTAAERSWTVTKRSVNDREREARRVKLELEEIPQPAELSPQESPKKVEDSFEPPEELMRHLPPDVGALVKEKMAEALGEVQTAREKKEETDRSREESSGASPDLSEETVRELMSQVKQLSDDDAKNLYENLSELLHQYEEKGKSEEPSEELIKLQMEQNKLVEGLLPPELSSQLPASALNVLTSKLKSIVPTEEVLEERPREVPSVDSVDVEQQHLEKQEKHFKEELAEEGELGKGERALEDVEKEQDALIRSQLPDEMLANMPANLQVAVSEMAKTAIKEFVESGEDGIDYAPDGIDYAPVQKETKQQEPSISPKTEKIEGISPRRSRSSSEGPSQESRSPSATDTYKAIPEEDNKVSRTSSNTTSSDNEGQNLDKPLSALVESTSKALELHEDNPLDEDTPDQVKEGQPDTENKQEARDKADDQLVVGSKQKSTEDDQEQEQPQLATVEAYKGALDQVTPDQAELARVDSQKTKLSRTTSSSSNSDEDKAKEHDPVVVGVREKASEGVNEESLDQAKQDQPDIERNEDLEAKLPKTSTSSSSSDEEDKADDQDQEQPQLVKVEASTSAFDEITPDQAELAKEDRQKAELSRTMSSSNSDEDESKEHDPMVVGVREKASEGVDEDSQDQARQDQPDMERKEDLESKLSRTSSSSSDEGDKRDDQLVVGSQQKSTKDDQNQQQPQLATVEASTSTLDEVTPGQAELARGDRQKAELSRTRSSSNSDEDESKEHDPMVVGVKEKASEGVDEDSPDQARTGPTRHGKEGRSGVKAVKN